MPDAVNIFWFRRDLRLHDNAGLFHALSAGRPVVPVFIFDRHILDELESRADDRVSFIYQALAALQSRLIQLNSSLDVRYGNPEDIFPQLVQDYSVDTVFTNHDYEPYARQRDEKVSGILAASGTTFKTFKDQVVFEKNEVVKDDQRPYTVFTPYSVKWKARQAEKGWSSYASEERLDNLYRQPARQIPSLESMGFSRSVLSFPLSELSAAMLKDYAGARDFPAKQTTSRLGVHLRFGTVSIREVAREAQEMSESFLNELVWRDFYQMILWHFPQVVGKAFKPAYDNIKWRNNENEFQAWCKGMTGYPIVDAGMRQLNETGYMHNRVRMITASFLTKHLLIDWRWGEAYFAGKLLDFDLASNNGGWQWAAGSGCDAAPYFRIFNPYLQTKKFDPVLEYSRKWVPELNELTYPRPIVEHEFARQRCLKVYSEALKAG